MTALDYYLWSAVNDKCYANKPETIDDLKDDILDAIGEIQLYIVDNVLKNWTNRVGYCMASRGIVLSNKKSNFRKYSVIFFKAFKKKLFGGPSIISNLTWLVRKPKAVAQGENLEDFG